MFTLEQINQAYEKVASGAAFPNYIQDLKLLGVIGYETWVRDSHTEYVGEGGYRIKSGPKYQTLIVSEASDKERFISCLKTHQQGKSDYLQFCKHCAATGIEKWIVNLMAMTCSYYNKVGDEVLVEQIPG